MMGSNNTTTMDETQTDSEEGDGHDENMEEDGAGDGKSEEEADDSNENEHGDGDGMNENDDNDNDTNAIDKTEGTATTMQSGHHGHQAFQDDGQSNANLNNDSNELNDQDAGTGIGSEDVTRKSTGGGTGDRLDRLKQARETADISDEGQRDGKERSENMRTEPCMDMFGGVDHGPVRGGGETRLAV